MISLAKSLNPEVMKCTKLLNLLACHLVVQESESVRERVRERERDREREREQLQAVLCLAGFGFRESICLPLMEDTSSTFNIFWAWGLGFTHRPLSSSSLGLPYRMENISHKRKLLRGLGYRVQVESGSLGWVGIPKSAFLRAL